MRAAARSAALQTRDLMMFERDAASKMADFIRPTVAESVVPVRNSRFASFIAVGVFA